MNCLSADLIGSCKAVPGTFLIHESIERVGDHSFGFSCRLVRRVACESYLWLSRGWLVLAAVCMALDHFLIFLISDKLLHYLPLNFHRNVLAFLDVCAVLPEAINFDSVWIYGRTHELALL